MKFLLALLGLSAMVFAQPQADASAQVTASAANKVDTNAVANAAQDKDTSPSRGRFIRDLPADILRDFPGLCFASTLCRVFKINEDWPLAPFCGKATCVVSENQQFLVERVEDCGPLPKDNANCSIINKSSRNETFPTCCPQFECQDGAILEYPTEAELRLNQQRHA